MDDGINIVKRCVVSMTKVHTDSAYTAARELSDMLNTSFRIGCKLICLFEQFFPSVSSQIHHYGVDSIDLHHQYEEVNYR